MSTPIANVVVGTDTFDTWLTKQNEIATAVSNIVVTIAANSAGALTNGNGTVNGIFAAITFIANAIGGGTIASAANLNITTNTIIANNVLFASVSGGNVSIGTLSPTATFTVNGTANISGNVALLTNLSVGANASINGTLSTANVTVNYLTVNNIFTFQSAYVLDGYSNTNLGTNTTSPLVVYSFSNATYSAGKFVSYSKNGNTVQVDELLVSQGNGGVTMVAYATVATPSANLGIYGAQINAVSHNIEITFQQNIANSILKVLAQMLI